MTNYIKSELYRIVRSKGIYGLVGGCSVLVLAMNLVLWYFRTFVDASFRYASTAFSFNMLTSDMQLPLCLTVCIASILFADEYKNRTISNSVAFGLSSTKVLLGKWLVSLFVGAISLVVVEGILVGSGYLLLENSGAEVLVNFVRANLACIPFFIIGVTGYLAFAFFLKNEMSAVWAWVGIMIGGDVIVSMLAMKFEFFQWLKDWLVFEMVGIQEFDEETGLLLMLWQQPDGMRRAVTAGILGTLVFLFIGVMGARNRDR